MSTAVLEMPAVTAVRPTKTYTTPASSNLQREVVQKQIMSLYDPLFTSLKEQYKIINEERVFTFLRQHRHLIPVLLEGRTVIKVVFGEETSVRLRLQRDPEVGIESLIGWIQSDHPSPDAVNHLMEFSDTWFLDQIERVGELLNFNLG